jgi:predicted N-formylglutamate amidohydrolase
MDIPLNSADAAQALASSPMAVLNRHGRGPVLLICEHASRYIPDAFRGLHLHEPDQDRHIAWDLGALELACELSAMFDAPLVHATYSRLLLDLNRPTHAIDSIVLESEGTPIPGNAGLDPEHREQRRLRIYEPFHAELDSLIDQRIADGLPTVVVSIHSFTPRYHGVERPWHVGVISRHDRRLAEPLLAALSADPALCVGDNLPYGPQHDGTFHSLERHGEARGLPGVMIEVRNDLLGDAPSRSRWAGKLREALELALRGLG